MTVDAALAAPATLHDVLRALSPTPASYLAAARQIDRGTFEGLTPLQVSILSTYTADLLRPYLVVEGAARGFWIQPSFAPFNQLEQQVLDEASALYAAAPDVIVLAARLEEMAPALVERFLRLSASQIEQELDGVEQRVRGLLEGLRRRTAADILVCNYAAVDEPAAGLADAGQELSQASVIQRANERLAQACRATAGAHVLDYARLVTECGLRRWQDVRLFSIGRVPFGAEAQMAFGRRLARALRALRVPPCKCLVVDLDNTLWGGILGEEGLGGIALGEDYPGHLYKSFQRSVRALRARGVLLAIASKNDEADARAVFERHPDCVLKWDDFAACEINWNDKASSLSAIAKTLNIGIDALALFDDNPAEREWVRAQLPAVTIIDVPDNPAGFAQALDASGAFDSLALSQEDRRRPALYQAEQARQKAQARSASVEEFLQQLQMTATIGAVAAETLPRVCQLLAKTNQFNLTTRRHTAADVQALLEQGGAAFWLRAADRFGDQGLVGVAIARPQAQERWLIDTLLLSCRVIGRRLETVLLSAVSRQARRQGARFLVGEYLPTGKNAPASRCYADHHFEPADADGRLWRWDVSRRGEIALPPFIMVRHEPGP